MRKTSPCLTAVATRELICFAGGLPCPPFSIAGKQLGAADERNLFPAAIRLVDETKPRAVMIENVRGFLGAVFEDYRGFIRGELKKLGYEAHWRLFNASDYGVPQLRPRVIIVALRDDIKDRFEWPTPSPSDAPTVGAALFDLMKAKGWRGAKAWAERANDVGPTLVGGSKKHGGPDLGPTRAGCVGYLGRQRQVDRRRCTGTRLCRDAEADCSHGCAHPRL